MEKNYKQLDKDYIINSYNRFDLLITHSDGVYCFDEQNNKYLDFTSGIGVNSLGYNNKNWIAATTKQLNQIQHISNLYYTTPCVDLARKLADRTGYNKTFFANSGAEANEGAIKIARKYSFVKYPENKNRNKILTLVNSFHGRTITTLSATGQEYFHNYFFPFNDGFDYVIANDIADLKSKNLDDICGIMIEFVQGEGGVVPLENDFVLEISKICKDNDILLIADEVQTGVGRTGKFLAAEHFNIKPNIVTLAKGLGNGLPIGAVLTDSITQDVLKYSDHGTTFGGNPVACAGAEVVLDSIDDIVLSSISSYFAIIKDELTTCDEVEKVVGLGLMVGITLKTKKAPDVLKEALSKGLMLLTAKDKIRLLPPLTIKKDELISGLNILKSILNN